MADEELTGQYCPNTHNCDEIELAGQYVPAAQTEMVLVFVQNDPPGQGLLDEEFTGQY
jgi:hypothetical protein